MKCNWKHLNQLKNSGNSCPTTTQDGSVASTYMVNFSFWQKTQTHRVSTLGFTLKFFLRTVKVNQTPASVCMVCVSCGLYILVNESWKFLLGILYEKKPLVIYNYFFMCIITWRLKKSESDLRLGFPLSAHRLNYHPFYR